jgi:hypothetical protein
MHSTCTCPSIDSFVGDKAKGLSKDLAWPVRATRDGDPTSRQRICKLQANRARRVRSYNDATYRGMGFGLKDEGSPRIFFIFFLIMTALHSMSR